MSALKETRIDSTLTSLGAVLAAVGGAALAGGVATGGTDKLGAAILYGAIFWVCLTLGCVGLMLLFHVTRGRWGTPILRIFEAGGSPAMLFFSFLLMLVCATVFRDDLYGGWLNAPLADLIVQRKTHYLNYPFFMARLVFYFAILGLFSYFLISWTRREELTGEKVWSDRRNNLAAPGIVVFVLVVNFFMTDAVMSIDPHWFSTVWGFLFTVGCALSAMAFAVMIVVSQKDKLPFAGRVDDLMMKDFGNMLLMLTMLWAYLSFSQQLIIWSGNLKEFIPFYLARLRGGFAYMGGALVVAQFLIPFLLLLSPRVKRTPILLSAVAAVIFSMRFVDFHWLVAPYFHVQLAPTLTDLGSLVAIGGVWLLLFGLGLRKAPLVTTAHPYQAFEGGGDLKEAEAHG